MPGQFITQIRCGRRVGEGAKLDLTPDVTFPRGLVWKDYVIQIQHSHLTHFYLKVSVAGH